MLFENNTTYEAGWTLAFARTGHEQLVVVAKATYELPLAEPSWAEPALAEQQVPLLDSDEFAGDPETTAMRFENDYATHKPRCDVVLHGSAYPPDGRPTPRVEVSMRVGALHKRFVVTGDRGWVRAAGSFVPSPPTMFARQRFSYDTAYGGTELAPRNPGRVATCLANPVGRGYAIAGLDEDVYPMPNTEELGRQITAPGRDYRPMALGPIGRHWQPRVRYGGSYDEQWLQERAPFWPDDFDYRYFQCAPPDQQVPYPVGGEPVELIGLTPAGSLRMRLPKLELPVLFVPHVGAPEEVRAKVDTIVLEPDAGRMTLTWRVTKTLAREVFELANTVVGGRGERWMRAQRARARGKTYYPSLGALVAARKRERGGA
ncbi:hypothetical protein ENSA5_36430 [Enhygromyxa salina]|uniref:DUF2169 domain-containing protein n=1 Tax=Enhygromyxa salina TaxID=215803 RepID=A0A2S9XUL5_9BACT|nr:DUF2169 domain-containing protein [Enhygromyxa salina]PRP96567.1 hypothetical protein ENSA5_36430 [Enhygromyxa salina]